MRSRLPTCLGQWLVCGSLLLGPPLLAGEAAEPPADNPPAPLITNVLQMRRLLDSQRRVVCAFQLEGTLCAVVPATGLLVLRDDTGTERFKTDWQGQSLKPGQRIILEGSNCAVTRTGYALAIGGEPVVENDGIHAMVDKSGDVYLTAGRHWFHLDWFNGRSPFGLKVYYRGPNLPRQRIPDSALFRAQTNPATGDTNFVNGLDYLCYQGEAWNALPDFNRLAAVKTGTVLNFDLGPRVRNENVGLRFAGYIEAPSDGVYTFETVSDDGSRLFIDEPPPQIRVMNQGATPAPASMVAGQILGGGKESDWAEATGMVTFVNEQANGLELELSSGTDRLRVVVDDAAGLSPILLLHAQARVVGVCQNILTANGQKVAGLMSVTDAGGIKPLAAAPELWDAYPVAAISAVRQTNFAQTGEPVVRVRGRVRDVGPGASLTVADDTGWLRVETAQPLPNTTGGQIEVLGKRSASGTNVVLDCGFYRSADETAQGPSAPLPTLTTAEQVQRLKPEEAARGYPVRIRGVITSIVPQYQAVVIQDSTRGIYVDHLSPDICSQPQMGDYLEIEGVTSPSFFAPLIRARRATHLAAPGRLPDPVHPSWDQLMNGSLDGQYVEIQGVVTAANGNELTLLLPEGYIDLNLIDTEPASLERYVDALVRVRGCLFASWNALTHRVRSGEIRFYTSSLNVDQWAPVDPYQAPAKRVGELRLFDPYASALKRVKVSGVVIGAHNREVFIMDGADGIRLVLKKTTRLTPGDIVEAAGFPELMGAASVLREAEVRKTGRAALPEARKLGAEELFHPEHDSTYVRMEGVLVNLQSTSIEQVLEIQVGLRTFLARLHSIVDPSADLPLGSRLELTGVYADGGSVRTAGGGLNSFELLPNSYLDIRVLERPPWLTLKRMLVMAGMLAVVLAGALAWITQLHRQVAKRTRLLHREIHDREQAEHQNAMEEERSRIARDLHDDLGSSLTEISMVAETGRDTAPASADLSQKFALIRDRAQGLVRTLDEIVWAVDPNKDTLPAAIRYLAGFAEEYLSTAGLICQVESTVSVGEHPLAAGVRHNLFLAVKEALANIIHHARATEVVFRIITTPGEIKIIISDNGRGFNPLVPGEGNGLGNMRKRMASLGGRCEIACPPGGGTTVLFVLPLSVRI